MRVSVPCLRLSAALLVFGVASAIAAPPPWAGGPHGAPPGQDSADAPQGRKAKNALDDRADPRVRGDDVGRGTHMARKPLGPGAYINDRSREAVRAYYQAHPPRFCPPGLAKKNNGCLPPGQAKKWEIGQRLPAGVRPAPVPGPVLAHLPKLPPGHRYVEVNGDILLVTAGTQIVVDGVSIVVR